MLKPGRGGSQVHGFGQVVSTAPDSWSGRFFTAERSVAVPEKARVDLLLPGGVAAPAVADRETEGLFSLQGLPPCPAWERLAPPDREETPQTMMREGYIEARGGSRITLENWVPVSQLPPMPPGTRFLIDYRPVREILVPFDWFLGAGHELAELGLKVAIVAEHPVAFGMSRQTILTAGGDEGRQFAVFRDYDEAKIWLLTDQ